MCVAVRYPRSHIFWSGPDSRVLPTRFRSSDVIADVFHVPSVRAACFGFGGTCGVAIG